MRIQSIEMLPFSLKNRCGLHLKINGEKGKWTLVEASPLPGYSKEQLSDVESVLKEHKERLLDIDFDTQNGISQFESLSLPNSLKFALFSALIHLESEKESLSAPFAALLKGSKSEIYQQAQQARGDGCTVVKLKVGNLSDSDAIEVIRTLSSHFCLRIDCVDHRDISFLKKIPTENIEFIEDIPKNAHTKCPIALDQKLRDGENKGDIWVVKPTLDITPLFSAKKPKTIISSSFETEIGLYHLIHLAHYFEIDSILGIGTLPYLDAPKGTHSINNGMITLQPPQKQGTLYHENLSLSHSY